MPHARVDAVSRLLYRRTGHTRVSHLPSMGKRVVAPKVSTQSVDMKVAHSAKTKQAWRYPGGQIIRAPAIRINNKEYEDPKDPGHPRRKNESNFFITVNFNKAMTLDNAEDHPVAINAMESMLKKISTDATAAQIMKFGPMVRDTDGLRTSMDFRQDKYADVIHSIDWSGAVEVGDNQHRLHAHIWFTVTHYSQVQINVPVLQHLARKFYNEVVDLTGPQYLHAEQLPFINVKLLPQSDFTTIMRSYIHKAMTV